MKPLRKYAPSFLLAAIAAFNSNAWAAEVPPPQQNADSVDYDPHKFTGLFRLAQVLAFDPKTKKVDEALADVILTKLGSHFVKMILSSPYVCLPVTVSIPVPFDSDKPKILRVARAEMCRVKRAEEVEEKTGELKNLPSLDLVNVSPIFSNEMPFKLAPKQALPIPELKT